MAVAIIPTDFGTSAISTTANPIVINNFDSGTPSSDRINVAAIGSRFRTTKPTAVTINGVSATEAFGAWLATANFSYSIWYAANPSGTTADVSVTFGDATPAEMGIGLFAMTGANAAPVDTDSGGGINVDNITLSGVTIPAGGGAVWSAIHGEQTEVSVWTNATKHNDSNLGSSRATSGYSTTAGTPSVLVDEGIVGATNYWAICGAAWAQATAPNVSSVPFPPLRNIQHLIVR